LLGAALVGWLRAGGEPPPVPPEAAPRPVRLEGTVVVPPLVAAADLPGMPALETRLGLETDDGTEVRVRVAGRAGHVRGGDRVQATGVLLAPRGLRNPGDPPPARPVWLLIVQCPEGLQPVPAAPSPLLARTLGATRESLYRVVELLYEGRMRGFVLAMLLGDRQLLDPGLRETLVLTGTFHLLAISGLHIVVIMFIALRVPVPAAARLPFRLLCLGAFTALTGASPPVARAAVMFLLEIVAGCFQRSPRGLNTLGWSATILLAWDPTLLRDLGFQLSFVSVASILTWGSRLAAHACRWRQPWRLLAAPLLLATGTLAGTAPLTLWCFHRVHPLSPLWNLLATPLTVVPLVGGGISVALGLLHPLLGMPCAALVALACDVLLWPLEVGAGLPLSAISLPAPPPWAALGCYGLLLAGLVTASRTRWRAGLLAAVVAAALPWCIPERPELWIFDAGGGDAALLRLPGAGSFLIDAGAPGRGVAAAEALARLVLAAGERRLRGVYLTHAHADHLQGLPGVLRRLAVDEVWVPPGFGGSASGRGVLEELRQRSIPVVIASRGLRQCFAAAGLSVEALFPPAAGLPARGPNDASLALRVTWRGSRLLCLGDLEEKGLGAVLAAGDDLRADVLLAPHHGRTSYLWPALLESVAPRTVAISGSGAGGGRATRAWLESRGIRVLATWQSGAIHLVWEAGTGWRAEGPDPRP
jgi:competence protein ComEC